MSSSCWKIQWDCGANERIDPSDVAWTLFYKDVLFRLHDQEFVVKMRNEDGLFSSTDYAAMFRTTEEGQCIISSEDVLTDSAQVRIYEGYVWEDVSRILYVRQDGNSYRINRRYRTVEGEITPELEIIWHRDFNDLWNEEDPRPEGLTQVDEPGYNRYFHLYYLPANFSATALDTLTQVPQDDRPYLKSVMALCSEMGDMSEDTPHANDGSTPRLRSTVTSEDSETEQPGNQITNTNTTPKDDGQNDPPALTETPEPKTPEQQTGDEVDEKLPPPTFTYSSVRFVSDTDDPPVAASQNEELTDCDEYYATHGHTLGYRGTDYGCEERYCGEYFSGPSHRANPE